jgi:malto-oligosyltrehalose synthase/4-alpha-glucanotransferase
MYNPVSTYRLQFHKGFTFKNLEEIIPYLEELGVRTIYASPIFEAAPGSNHGYDVVNPHRINPEIGTLAELRRISKKLKRSGIGWLQDIVPNHMAFHPNNGWLMDVLERGRESAYASYFDILWDLPAFKGRLMVPFLGDSLPELIESRQLKLTYLHGGFKFIYGDQAYPLNMPSVIKLLETAAIPPPDVLWQAIETSRSAQQEPDVLKAELAEAYRLPVGNKYIRSVLRAVASRTDLIETVANEQYYQLSYWKDSDTAINYRRFFTVNSLICLNIQEADVFEDYHRFIKALLDEGIFDGIRVDHIDGLFDPAAYLQRLRRLCGNDTYIVVEKILEEGEKFPESWPVQGTTGYDFLALVNNLATTAENQQPFNSFYRELAGENKSINRSVLEKKANILYRHMAGELENLTMLYETLERAGDTIPIDRELIKSTIAEFLIRCPVYRYYGNSLPLSPEENSAIENILASVSQAKPALKGGVLALSNLWLNPAGNDGVAMDAIRFYQRCMQLSGPLMAKGVEDTLMYTNSRFIGHNEVGDSPSAFGLDAAAFHQLMLDRQRDWPLSVNATATHDTKRGEDVRARLNSLTGSADDWLKLVARWQRRNKSLKTEGAPDDNDEYLIYQTLAGFYPLPGRDEADIQERLQAYLTKALREAKTHTQWTDPDMAYESGAIDFAVKLLDRNGRFWKEFSAFQQQIADQSVIISLSQTLLKFTCPGVPDIYQGTELWDLSLVDPDNRRPVDYAARAVMLKKNTDLTELWENRYDGHVKLWLIKQLLRLRQENPALFTGQYVPLELSGRYRKNVIAFARQHLREWLIVVAPLRRVENDDWADTAIVLADALPLQWKDIIANRSLVVNGKVAVSELFASVPIGLLQSGQTANKRSAGVLMHITSLPAHFDIGDLGPAARSFADFLSRSQQRYWQLLPLTPTVAAAAHSPYSAFSSMAGNLALISPEDLSRDGLLKIEEMEKYKATGGTQVDFEKAYRSKAELLRIAYERFYTSANEKFQAEFTNFCHHEAYWLDDFALYENLKTANSDKPWYEWPDPYRCRQTEALRTFIKGHTDGINRIKWQQFIFFRQWSALRAYGNERGVQFFGDLPFYVSYDSVDVWTHPQLFKLNQDKHMASVAGVPPDYFNANGQLWGMPVYDWKALADDNYKWWVDRIRRNMQFFDVIRLDHFRAFYDFWEVPATETTAVNGAWQPGPGAALFETFKQRLGSIPFIAEDLGEVSVGVYELRDTLGLPGMNLLQYAFGADMPVSVHAPHNQVNRSVTYTGTHDNNTTIGWFKNDSSAIERTNLQQYAHRRVNSRNVHDVLTEICYASVAEIAIVPLQDLLGLDERSRMNMPSSAEGNWSWQLQAGELTVETERKLMSLVKYYNR